MQARPTRPYLDPQCEPDDWLPFYWTNAEVTRNTQGNADVVFPFGEPGWLPVAGAFGL